MARKIAIIHWITISHTYVMIEDNHRDWQRGYVCRTFMYTCLSIQSIQSHIEAAYRYIVITALFFFIIIIMSLCARCLMFNDGIVCVQSNNNHAVIIHWLKGSHRVKVNEWKKGEKKNSGRFGKFAKQHHIRITEVDVLGTVKQLRTNKTEQVFSSRRSLWFESKRNYHIRMKKFGLQGFSVGNWYFSLRAKNDKIIFGAN